MVDAAADAGPLIHLEEVKAVRALGVFSMVRVPEPVVAELRARPKGPGLTSLKLGNVRRVALSRSENVRATELARSIPLSIADRSALVLAESHACVLLTDDLDLRDAAIAVGVRPVGTIGVLLRAAAERVLKRPEAKDALDALLEGSSLFITRPLIERAKIALSES